MPGWQEKYPRRNFRQFLAQGKGDEASSSPCVFLRFLRFLRLWVSLSFAPFQLSLVAGELTKIGDLGGMPGAGAGRAYAPEKEKEKKKEMGNWKLRLF